MDVQLDKKVSQISVGEAQRVGDYQDIDARC